MLHLHFLYIIECLVQRVSVSQTIFIEFTQVFFMPSFIVCVDSPVMQFFEEVVFLVLLCEFREHSSVVSEIIDKSLKRLTVSIKEDFVVNSLQLVHV